MGSISCLSGLSILTVHCFKTSRQFQEIDFTLTVFGNVNDRTMEAFIINRKKKS